MAAPAEEALSGGRFDRCLDVVLGHEGGISDHPADRGGLTNLGITAGTLREAIRRGIVAPSATVRTLTEEQARRIYFALYWTPARCHEFQPPLDLLLFDAYVNHRPASAVRLIQLAVGAAPDGIIGPETIRKANAIGVDMGAAIERYAEARAKLYFAIVDDNPSQRVFLRGWLNRIETLLRAVEVEAIA